MNSRKILAVAIALLLASGCANQTQKPSDAATETPRSVPASESLVNKWAIDPLTWKVVGPDSDADQLKLFNTPDQIEARRRAALVLTDPSEYYRQFPKTAAQLQADQKAEFEVSHPLTLDQRRAGMTPEQIATDDGRISLFLKGQASKDQPTFPAPAPSGPQGLPAKRSKAPTSEKRNSM